MGWTVREEGDDRVRWERADGTAIVVARVTATGAWAVTLDRLEQAPEGPTYERTTVDSREAALELAERWRETHDVE